MFHIYVADQQMHTAKNALSHIINYLNISVTITTNYIGILMKVP